MIYGEKLTSEINLNPFYGEFFNEDEVNSIIDISKQFKYEPGKTGTADDSQLDSLKRRSLIKWIPSTDNTYWIYNRFKDIVTNVNKQYCFDIVGGECIQYAEYNANDRGEYNWHIDYPSICRYKYMRKISVSVFLDNKEDFIDGEMVISTDGDDLFIPRQRKGYGVVFPSWISHRITPVKHGIRRSLVMWVYGPIFK